MTTADILRKAKGLLTPETWGQGGISSPPPRGLRCAEMAIDDSAPYAQTGAALALMEKVTGCERLAHWQDVPGRTLDEVLAAFDRAIALADQESSP